MHVSLVMPHHDLERSLHASRSGMAGGTEGETDSEGFGEVDNVDRCEVSALIGLKSYRWSVNINDLVPQHVESVVVSELHLRAIT
jgi:hypothetical protein